MSIVIFLWSRVVIVFVIKSFCFRTKFNITNGFFLKYSIYRFIFRISFEIIIIVIIFNLFFYFSIIKSVFYRTSKGRTGNSKFRIIFIVFMNSSFDIIIINIIRSDRWFFFLFFWNFKGSSYNFRFELMSRLFFFFSSFWNRF